MEDNIIKQVNNIIWHIETNRKVLGDKQTLDEVLKRIVRNPLSLQLRG